MSFLTNEKKIKLKKFCKFVKDELKLENPPRILIQNGRGELKTTANYDYTKDEKVIRINGKNRMLVDVMRSVAHELVHHKQFEQGRLKVRPPDIGGVIEDEANAKAGQFIKRFALQDETIYEETIRKIILEYVENEIEEQELSPSSVPESGASDTQKGGQGYPDVTTWEDIVGSKLMRGAANQIKNTKWSETVGSKITRGADNQLK